MSQNFVIAFGGTGARCVEALAYLAASNVLPGPLHVLVVDPDESNGNVDQALSQLRRYARVQEHLSAGSGATRPFFSAKLNPGLSDDSFFWANPNPHTEFRTLINYSALGSEARDLLNLLYDESDLELTFEKGYIGRAHIGSLDLLRTLDQHIHDAKTSDVTARPDSMLLFFRALREATQLPGGARLMVLGSVFGGTGASGIPAVPPLLRNALSAGLNSNLAIGCVQVAPYFSFPAGGEEDPDSALHPLATQAALYHYSLTDTGYNRIYLVGAPAREQSNEENVVGGDLQRNKAHYVELAAGLAAAHFFGDPPKVDGPAEVLACGAESVDWNRLPFRGEGSLHDHLVAFGTFCMMHGEFLARQLEDRLHVESKWHTDLAASGNRTLSGNEPELRELRDFARRFLEWAREIQRISDVQLFTIPEKITDEALGRVASRGTSSRPYHELYHRLNTPGVIAQETGPGWYVDALSRAATDFCKANYR